MISNYSPLITLIIITITIQSNILNLNSQQPYINNQQLDCNNNFTNTNGFRCNGNRSSCTAYLTFRSAPPSYATPPSIAFLLGSNPSELARLNNISDIYSIPENTVVIVPVTCSCTTVRIQTQRQRYYQHNANYRIKVLGENYFSMANNTYQGLSTCQAMKEQNSYNYLNLKVGNRITVPLMCACPTREQEKNYGAKFLVSYTVTWGDDVSKIADMFGVGINSVLDANNLTSDDVIYPFTPILVPIKALPTQLNFPSTPPASVTPRSNATPARSTAAAGSSSKKWVYIGAGFGGLVLVIFMCSLFAWCCHFRPSRKAASVVKEKRKGEESKLYTPVPASYASSDPNKDTKSWSVDLDGFKSAIGSLTVYKFAELEKATDKFSEANQIKGCVYKGEFNGDNAAIKILKGNVSTDEINLMKHINHSNIIRLSGYCIHGGNTYLVYEFAEKGSLDDYLFRQNNDDSSLSWPVLGWKQRVQIACNIADALSYLHSYVNPPYIHKNLKSSNVLLDSNYRAKVTNFGLARTIQDEGENGVMHLTKHVVGTHGYLAPEYIENGAVTPKMDVFAFGVVVLEILSGKPAVRPSGNNRGSGDDLLFVVIRNVFEGEDIREKLMGFMDSHLKREYPLDLAYSMAQLGYKCVDRDMNSRPSMSELSMTLSKIYSTSLDWDPSDELANSSSLTHSR